MKLLVTGAAGFIGSNHVRWLLAHRDDHVVAYDALTYAGNLDNLRDVWDDPRFTFVKGDIRDREAVRAAMGGYDGVVHFAAESHVDRSIIDPDAFVLTNCQGTNVVCDVARQLESTGCCTSPPTRSTARSRRALRWRPTRSCPARRTRRRRLART